MSTVLLVVTAERLEHVYLEFQLRLEGELVLACLSEAFSLVLRYSSTSVDLSVLIEGVGWLLR